MKAGISLNGSVYIYKFIEEQNVKSALLIFIASWSSLKQYILLHKQYILLH